MAKISFGSSKSKFRKFDDKPTEEKQPEIKIERKTAAVTEKKAEIPKKRSINEIFTALRNQLVNSYNIDDISIYLITLNGNFRLEIKKIYGLEISKYPLEKYYGFDCPMICTNAEGLSDNSSHRARLTEKYGKYLMIVSSSAFEAFKSKSELAEIRSKIQKAFDEVVR